MNYSDIRKKHLDNTDSSEAPKQKSGGTSYSDIAKKHGISYSVDQKYLNTFISDLNSFLGSAEEDYNKIVWDGDSSTYESRKKSLGDLNSRAYTIRRWLDGNRGGMDEETYKGFSDTLNSIEEAYKSYSQFDSADEYIKSQIGWLRDDAEYNGEYVTARKERYKKNQERMAEIEAQMPWYGNSWLPNFAEDWFMSDEKIALRDEYEKLQAENNMYDREQGQFDGYWNDPTTAEFKAGSQKRDYKNATFEELTEFDKMVAHAYVTDPNGNYIGYGEGIIGSEADRPVVEDKLGFWLEQIGDDNPIYRYNAGKVNRERAGITKGDTYLAILGEGVEGHWEQLEEGEIDNYYYIYSTQGQGAAYKYLKDMTVILSKRYTEEWQEDVRKAGTVAQIFMNIVSVPASVLGGITGLLGDAGNAASGNAYNPYSGAHYMSNLATTVRDDTAKDINDATGNAALPWVGTTWGDVYQSLMSGADALVGTAVGGNAYGVLMGAGAAEAEMKRLWEQGATTEQMVAGGISAAVVEGLTEKYSVESLFTMRDPKTVGQAVLNIMKQAGVEATEEMTAELANTITDAIIRGSQSDWETAVNKYIEEGYSDGEAIWLALKNDLAPDVVNAGIGGFISGAGSSTIYNIAGNRVYNSQMTKQGAAILGKDGANPLKQLALEMAAEENGLNAKSLTKAAGKVTDAHTKRNANKLGRLSDLMGETVAAKDASDVAEALVKKGFSKKDANRYADYLAGNKSLDKKEKAKIEKEIKDNDKIKDVVKEILESPTSAAAERQTKLLAARLGMYNSKASVDTEKATSGKLVVNNTVDVKDKVSESAQTTQISTGEAITIDKNNAIAKTKIVDGKLVVYYNTDKGVVEASDVGYASEEEGLIYESFADMNPAFANAIIKNYDGSVPVQTYIKGMREGVILYGMHNFQEVGKDISGNTFLAELSKEDQDFALKLGRAYAKANAKKGSNAIKEALKHAEEQAKASGVDTTEKKTKGGRVSFENGTKATTKSQRRAVQLAKILSKAIGIDIVFYDAMTTTDKSGQNANGYFDPKTNSIHLDLQNSKDDTKTIALTLSHEIVHFIKKWSPAKFNTFAKFLMEQYAAHGISTEQLLANKMTELKTTDANKAYEELVCDACERMLLDSNAVVKLAQLRKQDLSLFEKLKMHISNLLQKIRGEYKSRNIDTTTDEGQALQSMTDVLEKLHGLFEDAAVDAAQTFQTAKSLNAEPLVVTEDGTIQLQMKQYQQTGRSTLLHYLREQYGDNNANDLIATIDNIYNVMAEIKEDTALSVFGNWQDTNVELDADGHPIFTTSINNGDYELNQDFSRVCKKRRQLNFVLNMLAEDPAFEASHLTKDDFVKINKAIKEHGFEIACALCFVDSKRFRQAEWADSFANTWNDILGSIKADDKPLSRFNFATKSVNMADEGIQIDETKPITYRKWSEGKATGTRQYKNIHDLLAHDGNNNVRAIARLLLENPSLRHEFRGADIIASDGFDTIQRLAPDVRNILDGWGGSSVPKPSSNDAIYDNSILNIDGYNAEKAFAVGGVRMNSFSDFMAHMFFDYAQAFADLSAKKLPMHSYTKELDFARLFGLTGGKINMSAIAAIRKNATDLSKIKRKVDQEAAIEYEKSIAGLDISRLAEKLGKDESAITYDDVIENLDDVDYVWADESVDVKKATLLQTGILYDKLTDAQADYCYELIRNGQIDEAFRVAGEDNVNRGYAKHLGIITVGVSKAHILKLLRDPTIRMVIPYHRSGLNPAVARALNIAFYDDFTDSQNTSFKKDGKQIGIDKDDAKVKWTNPKNGKVESKKVKDFAFYDYFGQTIDGVFYDGKATAAKYVDWCENGVYDESVGDYVYYLSGGGYILASDLHAQGVEIIPKFDEFKGEENYYKLVEDFDCYDTITGEHSAQEAVDLFHDGLPSDYKDVLVKALKAEQKVSDDFKDHLDNKGLRDEIMGIVGKHGYTPSDLAATWGDIVETVGEENVGEATEQLTDVENTTHIKKQQKKISDNTYEAIGKELLYYEEGNLAPDLTLVETVNERTGKKEVTIKHYGQKPKGYIPKKIAYCYKLFEQHPDGSLHALFAGAKGSTPIGEWQYAQGFPYTDSGVKSMNLRERYGWHLSAGLPSAPHLMSSKEFERGYPSKNAFGHPKGSKRVWVRMAYDASTDFNAIADSTRAGDIFGLVPFGGYYAFKENNQSEWVISSAVKIDKILTEEERQQILKDAGYDEYEAWRKKHQPTAEEKAERDRAKRIPKAQRDAQLLESSQKMREAIKSRIIDNPDLSDGDIRYQKKRNPSEYAPTFYSQMGKAIEGIKMDKIGSASVINFLKGKGIRHDEIKWSGIEAFLEGKKSVTKQELQEFVASSQLQIVEEMSNTASFVDEDGNTYSDTEFKDRAYAIAEEQGIDRGRVKFVLDPDDGSYVAYAGNRFSGIIFEAEADTSSGMIGRWSKYKLDGGSNYRELVFQMPDSSYSNRAMRGHWGQDAEGILAHARIQDFTVGGKRMLFVEEIQSDWHNEGHSEGYSTKEYEDAVATSDDLYNKYKKLDLAFHKYVRSNDFMADPEDVRKKKHDWLRGKAEAAYEKYLKAKTVVDSLKQKGAGDTPDAPFSDTYHEYVMKRLLRMAAEEGYDLIGWTPADIQSERWSEEYAEGYRIEYDQDIPKFLRKYGKKWGATVGKTSLTNSIAKETLYDVNREETFERRVDWEIYVRKELAAQGMPLRDVSSVRFNTEGEYIVAYGKDGTEYDRAKVTTIGNDVWSMDITDSMQQSVLYEGQPLFQKKKVSNRTILANALESAIDTSTQEGQDELSNLRKYQAIVGKVEELEAKLAELREKANKIRFKKGRTPEETKQMNAIQFEANQTANQINTYDRQLLRLEAMSPVKTVLEREKEMVRRRTEQKGRERLAAVKERNSETVRKLLEHTRESRQKGIDGRRRTEMRHKVKDIVAELNKLLLKPTKDKHVPIQLQKPVAEALDIINMDTVGADERVARYNGLIAKAKTVEEAEALTKSRDRILEQGENLNKKLTDLKNAYAEIKNSDDPMVANAHDDVIAAKIDSVIKYVGETALRDMSFEQLEMVYDLYKMVYTTVNNANQTHKAKTKERIDTLASRVMEEEDNLPKKAKPLPKKKNGKERFSIRGLLRKLNWNNQKPTYAMQRIGSKTFAEIFDRVRDGEDTWARDVLEARLFYIETCKKHGYSSWNLDESFTFKSATGKEFEVSLSMIMSLYAYSKRGAQAIAHITNGGIVLNDGTENANTYKLSEKTLTEMIGKMTPEQKAFADEMQEYLSTTMGEKGNEVSLELYGIKLFKEKFYFPLKSSGLYQEKSREQDQSKGEVKIKNYGMTKQVQEGSKNPIILDSFVEVWANHVNEMSMYHAFVLSLEDFYRVYNYHTPYAAETEGVRGYIQTAHGSAAVSYIDQLLKDLNGGAVSDPRENWAKPWLARFKKAATMLSLSTIIQQPTSMIRAMALIDAKYFVGKPSKRKHRETWEEVKKYAPVAVIKEMGYFDTNMGRSATDFITGQEYHGLKEKFKAFFKDGSYRDEIFSKAPALADELAWCGIWQAVKRETMHNRKDLIPTSEEFLKLCGERFTEVITKTQVYDSVLSRSGNMRSKSVFMNMVTAFMGEPTTSLNMVQDAILKIQRGDKKGGSKAIRSVIGSVILNAALVSLVYAARDEDEDETYAEKYFSRLTSEMIDGLNPLTYIPFVKDVWSIAQGFDVERTDMSLLSDLVDSLQQIITVSVKDTDGMSSAELEKYESQVWDAWLSLVDTVGSLAGLPTKNLRREVESYINFGSTVSKDATERDTTFGSLLDSIWGEVKNTVPVLGWFPDESKGDKLYDAIMDGDKEYVKRLKDSYSESAYQSAIRKALRENDPRIKEAAQANVKGDYDKYNKLAEKILREGNFSKEDIKAAIQSEINAMTDDEKKDEPSKDKEVSFYEMEYFYSAVVDDNIVMATAIKEDIIRTAIANGKDRDEAEKDFNSSFQSSLGGKYKDGELTDYEARRLLISYGGLTEKEAASKVQYWDFKMEYPDSGLSESAVKKYYSDIEPSGINVDVYEDYCKQRSKCTGTDSNGDGKADNGTVKAEILAVIDSLPLTSSQKDALYYAEGWAASKLWQAPWR